PEPFATRSVSNTPTRVPRPVDPKPLAPPGYTVALYVDALDNPRLMRTAPNGDIFVAESGPGRIKVLRGRDSAGRAQTTEVFADGVRRPFGIGFHPPGPSPQQGSVARSGTAPRPVNTKSSSPDPSSTPATCGAAPSA